jgi:O-antigen/teichoic acid export membrane protein
MKRFRPLFSNIKQNFIEIWGKNKEYGFYIFMGQCVGNTTYRLDGFLITYFVNTTKLGYYSLANNLCAPMIAMSAALSQSLFKRFSIKDRVPKKVFIYNGVWLGGCVMGLLVFGRFLVEHIFGGEFTPVYQYIFPLSLAYFIHGMYMPANEFLSVKGKGKWMRNCSVVFMIVNVIGNLILIPLYGAMGAAWASLVSMIGFAIPCLYYYRKLIKK